MDRLRELEKGVIRGATMAIVAMVVRRRWKSDIVLDTRHSTIDYSIAKFPAKTGFEFNLKKFPAKTRARI
jgi:hypothetical protein